MTLATSAVALATSGVTASSSCLLTGYHCTVTQLTSHSSRTVHAPTFTPEVGVVCSSPISTSPLIGTKSSPDSSPETSRSGSGAADDILWKELRRGDVRSDSVEASTATPERSSSIGLHKATSDSSRPIVASDRAEPGELSASKSLEDLMSPSPLSTTSATHSTDVAPCRGVNIARGGPGVVSHDSNSNATLTTKRGESPADIDVCKHGTTDPSSISADSDVGESAMEAPASVSTTGRSHSHAHSPRITRPVDDVGGRNMSPLSVDSSFYSEQDRRRMAVLSGGWHREMHKPRVAVGTNYTPSATSRLLPGCVSMSPGQTMVSVGDTTGHRAAIANATVVDLSAGSSRSRDKLVDPGCCSPRRSCKTVDNVSGASKDTNSSVDLKGGASRVGVAAPSSRARNASSSVTCNKNVATNAGLKTNSVVADPWTNSDVAGRSVDGDDDVVDLSVSRCNGRNDHTNSSPLVDVNTSALKTDKTKATRSRMNHRQDMEGQSPYKDMKRSHQDTPPCAGRLYNKMLTVSCLWVRPMIITFTRSLYVNLVVILN